MKKEVLFDEFVNQSNNVYMGDGCGSYDNCDCYEDSYDGDEDW